MSVIARHLGEILDLPQLCVVRIRFAGKIYVWILVPSTYLFCGVKLCNESENVITKCTCKTRGNAEDFQ